MSHQLSEAKIFSLSSAADWSLNRLMSVKHETRIAVVIPARNEQDTVGHVVESIRIDLAGLIDELIVMDSLSTDGTSEEALQAGAQVFSVADVRPDLGIRSGKGEALWKSLFVTSADVIAYIDADLTEWGSHFVRGVVGPLLVDPSVLLCRGFYDRVLDIGSGVSLEGGRVTELVARPWLSIFRPELTRIVQPLAGEWAIRRTVMQTLCVPVGYGIEMSSLLDVYDEFGPEAIAQVDLGRRAHRHQAVHDLSAMALEILAVAERRKTPPADRSSRAGGILSEVNVALHKLGEDRQWTTRQVDTSERPPHMSV